MFAVLSKEVNEYLMYYDLHNLLLIKSRLLSFVRTGFVNNTMVGLCNNFELSGVVKRVTGKSYVIQGKPYQTPRQVYIEHVNNDTLYVGDQLRRRRKLAVRLINIINQHIKENYEYPISKRCS